MATIANGVNGATSPAQKQWITPALRYSDIPATLEISLGDEEDVDVNLDELHEDPMELCTLLENENVSKNFWMVIALAYAKDNDVDHSIEILTRGLSAFSAGRADERLSILTAICWMYLWKLREAPRLRPDNADEGLRLKDYYIQQATATLNEASRISPSYSPLFLARGVLSLLRYFYQSATKSSTAPSDAAERSETLRQAQKAFEDAYRASRNTNVMAAFGKARVLFTMRQYPQALETYQEILEKAPRLADPDPRIGIGCCLWQLGHKEDARLAWERALEINPSSQYANVLIGIYYLQQSAQYNTSDPNFVLAYKKAMQEYTQKAFKLDDKLPLACSNFGNFFLMRKAWSHAERLARKSIELTDVNAIASDGWYLLARKEHHAGDIVKANEYYLKSDQARGGDDQGYLPAKFGAAQVQVMLQDFDGAKFRLEKLVQGPKNIEVMALLGTLYAEEIINPKPDTAKDDILRKKAIAMLEQVRLAWKDPKKNMSPDIPILLNLARLYELDAPDKALACLKDVEQMEIDSVPNELRPTDIEGEDNIRRALREHIPPQLLNNIGVFHYNAERFSQAQEFFQIALNACVRMGQRDPDLDSDALVTSISYNLGRAYEAEGQADEAKKIYEGLLERHPGYVDAHTRLAYIAFQTQQAEMVSGNKDGATNTSPAEVSNMFREALEMDPKNLEIRAMYGWFLNRTKKRTLNFAEDTEQRHSKHTLMERDKHDGYVLTGMGNMCLAIGREMRGDEHKDRRRRQYERAVEFFDKALVYDPANAYAAQGIGIAVAEEKKDLGSAVQIFSSVRETMKDGTVYMNLGHAFCELRQYSRAIENYEAALNKKDRVSELAILPCLGRVWLLRGRHEQSLPAMKTALEYSRRALDKMPDHPHFQFNVAYVQFQIGTLVPNLPPAKKTSADVEAAIAGIDEAVETLFRVAKAPNPPYPRHDVDSRAKMGKNTVRKQLERALEEQRKYEEGNRERLERAKEVREKELREREERKEAERKREEERRKRVQEEREKLEKRDREIVEARSKEEERRREEEEEIAEGKRKRVAGGAGSGKRRRKDDFLDDRDGSELEEDGTGTDTAGGEARPEGSGRKKRKLERRARGGRAANALKYKSSEVIVDSDEEAMDGVVLEKRPGSTEASREQSAAAPGDDSEVERPVERRPKGRKRVIDDDDDDEEENPKDVDMEDGLTPAPADGDSE